MLTVLSNLAERARELTPMANEVSGISSALQGERRFGNVIFVDDLTRETWWPAKEFFYDLLREPIYQAIGVFPGPSLRQKRHGSIELQSFDRTTTQGGDFDSSWVNSYEQVNIEIADYLTAHITPGILVIGYELTPGLISFLEARKIDWIDFRISPIRFLQDLVIAVRSSIPQLQSDLASLAVHESEIRLEAGRLIAAFRHSERYSRMKAGTMLSEHTVYVIGQTQGDTSLVKDGKIITLNHYEDTLRSLLNGKRSLYVPHPATTQGHALEEYSFLRSLDGNIEPSQRPLYDLFCSEQPAEFVGISSGALQEARFFRRKATTLYRPICPILYPDVEPRELEGFWQIPLSTFTSPKFFKIVFGIQRSMERTPLDQVERDQLRKLHDVWWGYAAISGRPNQATHFNQRRLEEKLSEVEKRIGTTVSLLLDYPRTSDPIYANLLKMNYEWYDGSIVSLKSDGNVLRNQQNAGIWSIQKQNDPSVIYISWEKTGQIDKVVRNPEWDHLICQTGSNSFLHIRGKLRT